MSAVVSQWLDKCSVYTPDDLALAIVRSVCHSGKILRCLEPSYGEGAFVRALRKVGAPGTRVIGIEIDETKKIDGYLDEEYLGEEFVRWARAAKGVQRFDVIVGNPPFSPIQSLPAELKKRAASVEIDGARIGERANLWAAFVLESLQLLSTGGSIGFVLPASWDYAGYSRPVRAAIERSFRKLEVYRSGRPLFDGVQEGAVVVIGRGFALDNERSERILVKDRNALIERLNRGDSRSSLECNSRRQRPSAASRGDGKTFGSMAKIRIGAVTGHADYFLLSEEDRKGLGIPVSAVRPVLSRAAHLVEGCIAHTSWMSLCNSGERVWLFWPNDSDLEDPAVRDYLERPVQLGGCRKSARKVRERRPWYRTRIPARADGFISGMVGHGPAMAVNAMESLTATNTLYVVEMSGELSSDEKAAVAGSLLLDPVREQCKSKSRKYADGLSKLEPSDLGELVLPTPRTVKGAAEIYPEAYRLFVAGKRSAASRLIEKELF